MRLSLVVCAQIFLVDAGRPAEPEDIRTFVLLLQQRNSHIALLAVLNVFALSRNAENRHTLHSLGAVPVLVGWVARTLLLILKARGAKGFVDPKRAAGAPPPRPAAGFGAVAGPAAEREHNLQVLCSALGALWALAFCETNRGAMSAVAGFDIVADVLKVERRDVSISAAQQIAAEVLWCAVEVFEHRTDIRRQIARLNVIQAALELASDRTRNTGLRLACTKVLMR